MPRFLNALLIALVLLVLPSGALAAPTATPTPKDLLNVTMPRPDTAIGGVVSIMGTVQVARMQHFELAFGPGTNPWQWIPIGERRSESVADGRLALWDTTTIPDGLYTLRVRAVRPALSQAYVEVFVSGLLVSNAPTTPTPAATLPPTQTPTPTATATPSSTPIPTPRLGDGVSPYLSITLMDQFDPLCKGLPQRYSVWLSNIGMVTLTNVVLTSALPLGMDPVLVHSSPGARTPDERVVVWELGDLPPAEAIKIELLASVATWLEAGDWVSNQVWVTCDQVPRLSRSEPSLLSDCPWLRETAQARPVVLPTRGPSATPTPTVTRQVRPTLLPTVTPLSITVSPEGIDRGLDLLTIGVAAALVILLAITIYLIYRKVIQRR
jgi:hypothetical protein